MLLHSDGHSIEKNIPTDSEEDLGNSFPSLIFFFIRKCVVKLKTGPNQEKHTHTHRNKKGKKQPVFQRGCESWRDFYRYRNGSERN